MPPPTRIDPFVGREALTVKRLPHAQRHRCALSLAVLRGFLQRGREQDPRRLLMLAPDPVLVSVSGTVEIDIWDDGRGVLARRRERGVKGRRVVFLPRSLSPSCLAYGASLSRASCSLSQYILFPTAALPWSIALSILSGDADFLLRRSPASIGAALGARAYLPPYHGVTVAALDGNLMFTRVIHPHGQDPGSCEAPLALCVHGPLRVLMSRCAAVTGGIGQSTINGNGRDEVEVWIRCLFRMPGYSPICSNVPTQSRAHLSTSEQRNEPRATYQWYLSLVDLEHNHDREIPVGGSAQRPPSQEHRDTVARFSESFSGQHISKVLRSEFADHRLDDRQISNMMNDARRQAREDVAALGSDIPAILAAIED
ncbi:hypothetical protein B0H13DRAFT_2267730 [Mycena leptocephala]|nr:hypothetical protein B0H13DRAFT_2267730 [Mycena leptocephala]